MYTVKLGNVALARFNEAQAAGRVQEELIGHLNDALQASRQSLAMLPTNAVNDLALVHNQLGAVYASAGDLDRALPHFREAIRYREAQGNRYGAGQTRYNVALLLAQHGRLPDARLYAEAALRDFESYGARAAADVQNAQQLLALIDQLLNST